MDFLSRGLTIAVFRKSGASALVSEEIGNIWDHENYPSLEYGKRENMKLGTWNMVILKFELGNLQGPLGNTLFLSLTDKFVDLKQSERTRAKRKPNQL